MLLTCSLFVGSGLLLIALGIPLVRRRIRPNHWYGLRVPATFADEWVWYEANARSGRDMVVLGAVIVILALLLFSIPGIDEAVYGVILAGVTLIGAIAMAIAGMVRAGRLLRERRKGGAP